MSNPIQVAICDYCPTIRYGLQHILSTAANIHKSWIDASAELIFEDVLGRDIFLMNDAVDMARDANTPPEGYDQDLT